MIDYFFVLGNTRFGIADLDALEYTPGLETQRRSEQGAYWQLVLCSTVNR